MKSNRDGFSAVEGLLVIFIIGVLILGGWLVYHRNQEEPTLQPQKPTVNNQPTQTSGTFSGMVTGDECINPKVGVTVSTNGVSTNGPPIGDVGCFIIVGRSTVFIVHGNANVKSWGSLEGFTAGQDITGKKVEVKADKSSSEFYISKADDYVKLLN